MRIIEKNGQIFLQGVVCFDLERTLDCGQCFRWKLCPDGFWEGIGSGNFCRIKQERTVLTFTHTSRQLIRDFWIPSGLHRASVCCVRIHGKLYALLLSVKTIISPVSAVL